MWVDGIFLGDKVVEVVKGFGVEARLLLKGFFGGLDDVVDGVETLVGELLEDGGVDLVTKVLEGDGLAGGELSVDVDGCAEELAGEVYVLALGADGEGYLLWLEVDGEAVAYFLYVVDLGGGEGAFDEEGFVVGVADDVDLFVPELPAGDVFDALSAVAYAGADGVDAVVLGGDDDFGPLSGAAYYFFDFDDAFGNFVDLVFKGFFEEARGCPGDDDTESVVLNSDFLDDGVDVAAFFIFFVGDLVFFGEEEFVFVGVVEDGEFGGHVVDLCVDQLAFVGFVAVVESVPFDLLDPLGEDLEALGDGASAEDGDVYLFGGFFAYLKVGF